MQLKSFSNGSSKTVRSSFLWRLGVAPFALLASSLMASTSQPVFPVEAATISIGSVYMEGQVTEALKDVQSRVNELNLETDLLQTYARGLRQSKPLYAAGLNQVREHINVIGKQMAYLQTVKEAGAPWQRSAIDQMVPIAVQIAGRAESAIGYLNERPGHLFAPEYVDHVNGLYQQSARLKQVVDNFVDLDKTQKKLASIQMHIEEAGS